MRKVQTVRFGEIDVDEKTIVHFENGIPAFDEEHEFLIIPYDEESPYVFLQSLTTPDLAFLMTVPFVFFPDYEFEINDDAMKELGIRQQDDLLIFVLLTLPGGRVQDMTANLMAPVVVNKSNMRARQVVLDRSQYTTKHRLFPEEAAQEA